MGIFSDIGRALDGAVGAVGDGAKALGKWIGDAVSTPFAEEIKEGDPKFEESIPSWFQDDSSFSNRTVTKWDDGTVAISFRDVNGTWWEQKQDPNGTFEEQIYDREDQEWRVAEAHEEPMASISQAQQKPPDPIILTEDDLRGSPDDPVIGRVLGGPTSIANPPADPMYTLPPPPEDPEPFIATRKLGKVNLPPEEERYPDGSVAKHYPDGSATKWNPDGSGARYYPDGREEHYDASGNLEETRTSPIPEELDGLPTDVKVSRSPDGDYVAKYPDGSVTNYYPDGTEEYLDASGKPWGARYPDGGYKNYNPDGSSKRYYPDGTEQHFDASGSLVGARHSEGSADTYNPDGSMTRYYPDGREAHFDASDNLEERQGIIPEELDGLPTDVKVSRSPDGGYVAKYPDGREENYDASGNIVEARNPDGSVTKTLPPPAEQQPPVAEQEPAPAAPPPYEPPATGMPQPDGDGDGIPNEYGDGLDLDANGIPDETGINPDSLQPGYPDKDGDGVPDANANEIPQEYGDGPDLDGNGVPDEIGINPDNQQPGYPNTPSQGDDGEGIPGLGVPYQDFIPFSPMVQDPTTGQWRNAEPGEIADAQGGDADQLPYVVNDDGTYTITPSQAQVQEEETLDPIPSSGPSPFGPPPAPPSGEGHHEDQEVPPLQFGNTGNFNNTAPSDEVEYEEQEVPPLQFGNTGNLQNAPDATLFEEDLFNPEAPGPTLSTDLFDPTAQGPTLDTGLIPDLAQNPHLAKMLNDNLDMAAALERNPSMFDQLKQDSALLAGETSDVTQLESFRDASLEPEDVPEPDVVDQDVDAMS